MAYKKFKLGEFFGDKAYQILLKNGYSMKEAQKLCDKGRVSGANGVVFAKNDTVFGEAFFIDYECEPRGIKPIFECEKFAIFDKPSGVLSHPNGRNCTYSLYDEIWTLFGREACITHRLDRETSGVIVVAKNKKTASEIKGIFESRAVAKSYYAFVSGKFMESECEKLGLAKFESENLSEFMDKISLFDDISGFVIDKNMDLTKNYDDVKIRMEICENGSGKRAVTIVKPIFYDEKFDTTLVECFPLTGRQHQIRLHLFHMKHKILGDPLYGLERNLVEMILDEKMSESDRVKFSGAKRLMLHANRIKFQYENRLYDIKSQMKFSLEGV